MEACAAELRARLPTPGQVGSCRAPLKLLLEVRRLRCETLAGPEAKRCFHLSNADLSCLALVKVSHKLKPLIFGNRYVLFMRRRHWHGPA